MDKPSVQVNQLTFVKLGLYPIALAAYVASFFLPALQGFKSGPPFPGWYAAWASFCLPLIALEAPTDVGAWTMSIHYHLMFMANVFVLISPWLVFRTPPKIMFAGCLAFLLPVVASLSQLLFYGPGGLLVGYYVWAFSVVAVFTTVVVIALVRRSKTVPESKPEGLATSQEYPQRNPR